MSPISVPASRTITRYDYPSPVSPAGSRPATGLALEVGAVANQGKVAALLTTLAFVALYAGFRCTIGIPLFLGEARPSPRIEPVGQLLGDLAQRHFAHQLFFQRSQGIAQGDRPRDLRVLER